MEHRDRRMWATKIADINRKLTEPEEASGEGKRNAALFGQS